MFELAVDGGCSNAYAIVLRAFEQLPIEAKRVTVTLDDIYKALEPLAKQWEKRIEEVTEA